MTGKLAERGTKHFLGGNVLKNSGFHAGKAPISRANRRQDPGRDRVAYFRFAGLFFCACPARLAAFRAYSFRSSGVSLCAPAMFLTPAQEPFDGFPALRSNSEKDSSHPNPPN